MRYYTLLGVEPTATQKEIKAAYHRLARRYHPDVQPDCPDAEERFKQINAAYQVLSKPTQRAKYDRTEGVNWAKRKTRTTPPRTKKRSRAYKEPTPTVQSRYTVDQMNIFIFDLLRNQVDRKTIITRLATWAHISPSSAATFVHYAETIYRCETRPYRPMWRPLIGFTVVSLFGLFFNNVILRFVLAPNPYASPLVLIGLVLFWGGLIGIIYALDKTLLSIVIDLRLRGINIQDWIRWGNR